MIVAVHQNKDLETQQHRIAPGTSATIKGPNRTRRTEIIVVHTVTVLLLLGLQLALMQAPSGVSEAAETANKRFFRMGDGQIHLRNAKTGREVNVELLKHDGSLDEAGLTAIDGVFGFSPGEKHEHVSLRLIFLLDYFSDRVAPGRVIDLQSGYRDPEHNQQLRRSGAIVAPTSTHMDAMAIDFSIKGFDGKQLWETIRKEDCCGAGHYGGNMVHLDSGRPRFWEAATSGVESGDSDFNRRIYLSTQYDLYRSGETVRLTLSSVSNYPFGVKRAISILTEGSPDEERAIAAFIQADDECVPINDRADGRSLRAPLPRDLPPGRYRIRVEYCRIPFQQMPTRVISNPVEVVRD
jgi:uncharacterized protein YcbK (DUF882 family)